MREIKFRAWDKKNKTMFMVHEIHTHRISGGINWIRGYGDSDRDGTDVYGGGLSRYKDGPRYLLMQFTGLKDKNGVDIYEGDIFRLNGFIYVVEWRVKKYCWILRGVKNNEDYYSMGRVCMFEAEIIGNIYENPNLIEVQ